MLKFYIFYSQFIIKNMQEVTSKKESKDHCSCLICVIKMKKLTKKWLPCPTRPITKPFSIACYFFKDLPQITKRNENQALTREKLNLVKHQLTISAYVDCKKKKKSLFLCKYLEEFSYAICGIQVKEIIFLTALQQGPVYLERIDNR